MSVYSTSGDVLCDLKAPSRGSYGGAGMSGIGFDYGDSSC